MIHEQLPNGGLLDIGPQVMEDPVEQVLRQVEAYADDKLGWDARPIFLSLHRTPWMFGARDMNYLPDHLYSCPAETLPSFTAFLKDFLDAGTDVEWLKHVFTPAISDFYGCALLFEGWSVAADQSGKDALAQKLGSLTPSQHPDRVEVRNGIAITIDGKVSIISRVRGKTPIFEAVEAGGLRVRGRLPEALQLFVKQIQQISALP